VKLKGPPQQSHLVPGYRLDGRYELLYPFAQGGMATVWVARVQGKHGFEKLVAVKTILPHLASDDGFRAMFLDEAAIASRIRHPNVADIDDLGEEASTLYMVLEWISGDAWSRLYNAIAQAGHDFPVDALLRIAADACAGLHAAHELRGDDGALLNVVHRDVSPQNILVSTAGVTKVIDFGIAKALDRMSETTKTGLLKGKASYAAPEQVKNKGLDRRADLWAIGTILYQFLTGELPYQGKNDLATLRELTSGKPPKPLPREVPPQVASVVMTALAYQPEGRFATALDMQRALEAAIRTPTTSNDIGALVNTYLADRIEERRRDLQDALAEAVQRAGPSPTARRGRLASFPELAPPASLKDALAGRAPGSSAPEPSLDLRLPAHAPAAAYPPPPAQAPPPASSPPRALAPREVDDAAPTRVRGGLGSLKGSHWALMIVGALVPISVWTMVVVVALDRAQEKADAQGGKPSPALSASAASPRH
jgi:eukaryotic-like serine/threonine-protein kinase